MSKKVRENCENFIEQITVLKMKWEGKGAQAVDYAGKESDCRPVRCASMYVRLHSISTSTSSSPQKSREVTKAATFVSQMIDTEEPSDRAGVKQKK